MKTLGERSRSFSFDELPSAELAHPGHRLTLGFPQRRGVTCLDDCCHIGVSMGERSDMAGGGHDVRLSNKQHDPDLMPDLIGSTQIVCS